LAILSQQEVSADIIQNSAVGTSPKKQKEERQKQLDVFFSDVFSLPVHLNNLQSSLTVYSLPSLSAC
jgi:hypothetical protein